MKKRTLKELERMPRPENPAELEVLSRWYFGKALHLRKLRVYSGGGWVSAAIGSATYEVEESYNDYHGDGWLHGQRCIRGYDYSAAFWRHVIGPMHCGGIARASYGQANVFGHRNLRRLKRFEEYLRRNESGRLRKSFERLAREHGAGGNTVNRDSRVLTTGRGDGAGAAFLSGPNEHKQPFVERN